MWKMPIRVHEKWGFGMALPKPETQRSRLDSCAALLQTIEWPEMPAFNPSLLEQISIVKGLFNRIARQDQWDWFIVSGQFGYPSLRLSQSIAYELGRLRSSIRDQEEKLFSIVRPILLELPLSLCLHVFLGTRKIRDETGAGWIYILSTRQSNQFLKIGMTTRTVEQRVQEINSATGVVIPFGVRRCWRVRNPTEAERIVHVALSEYRIRNDREFFEADFMQIVPIVQNVIVKAGLEIRTLNALTSLE